MLLFCPSCSNVLTVSTTTSTLADSPSGAPEMVNCLECQTCPYQYVLTRRFYERKNFTHKEKTDVFGGPDEFKNAPKQAVQCTKQECEGTEAAWYQVQIRSADEPMTTFYQCMTCFTKWREN